MLGKGEFTSLDDFFFRTADMQKLKVLPKKITESLICAGSFDCFANNREELLERYGLLQKIKAKDPKSFQYAIQQIFKDPFTVCDKKWNHEHEIAVLTALISEDPLSDYKDDAIYGCTPFENLKNGTHYIMGFLSGIEEKLSKKGNHMQIAHLLGHGQRFDVLFMNREVKDIFNNTVVRIKGQYKDGSFFGRSLERLPNKIEPYYLVLDTKEKSQQATSIMKWREDGLIPLTIEFHFNKYLEPMIPKIATFHVDLETIKKLKARKIQYMR